MKQQHRTSNQVIGRWTVREYDWAYGERTIMRVIARVLVREFGGSSCNLIFRICTIPRGDIGTAASMVLS